MARTPTPAELAEVKAEFERCKAEAERTGGVVCGTYRSDGRPVYWVAPRDGVPAEDDRAGEDTAFERLHGRRPEVERKLMSLAKSPGIDRWRGAL